MADEVDDLSDILGPEPDLSDILGPEPAASPPPLTPGRALQRLSRARGIRPRKLSNDRMIRVLTAITQMPVTTDACWRAGISTSTLKYWLTKSVSGGGGDGFDVVFDENTPDETVRFHEAWDDAMAIGLSLVERALHERALGYREVLTYQGRVVYKHDPELVALFGYECMQTYLRDPITNEPVPEAVIKQDPDLLQFIVKTRLSETYGTKATLDINHRGGVLVVAAVAKTSEALASVAQDYKADAVDVEFSEVDEAS